MQQRHSVPDILEKFFPNESGVCVNWQCYGTSYVGKAPEGNLLGSLSMKSHPNYEWNHFIKSIFKPDRVINFDNPHYANYLPGFYQVNTQLQHIVGGKAPTVHLDLLRINHYWTRDEWYLNNVKIPRQERFAISKDVVRERANNMNSVYDPISNYVK